MVSTSFGPLSKIRAKLAARGSDKTIPMIKITLIVFLYGFLIIIIISKNKLRKATNQKAYFINGVYIIKLKEKKYK